MPPPLYKNLTLQVLTAVAIGILIGMLWPDVGIALEPLTKGFIKLVKFIIAPVIFLTIVGGIAGMGDLKRVGRVGLKALIYFEVVTTIALAIGLVIANVLRPGAGVDITHINPDDVKTATAYAAKSHTFTEWLLGIIPDSALGPFVGGDALQVLFVGVLVGAAIATMPAAAALSGEKAAAHAVETRDWIVDRVHRLTEVMFRIVAMIMRLAPIGAMGAMAATVGRNGPTVLLSLAKLMGCVYATMVLFIILVLGSVLRICGVSLWRYLVYIKHEILLVLGTSSSESALPRMIVKMQAAGCGRDVPGLVIPAGYSFNLDGTSIYLSMAVLFIAQAYGVELTIWHQIEILAVLLLTSKGAAAVTGGGFITLSATLGAAHSTSKLPVEGLALLVGVDRFMSEARAITNLIGNGVAAIAISKMEREFDPIQFRAACDADSHPNTRPG